MALTSAPTGRARRWTSAAALAVLVTMLPPATATASATYTTSFHADGVRVDGRGGRDWIFDVTATRYSSPSMTGVDLVVGVTLERKGERGPLRQTHTWRWPRLPADVLTVGENLTGTLDTRDHLGGFGRLDLRFFQPEDTYPIEDRCDTRGTTARRTRVDGSLRFDTGRDEWGSVTRRPDAGTIARNGCSTRTGDSVTPCPPDRRWMRAGRSTASAQYKVRASEEDRADSATVRVVWSKSADEPFTSHRIVAVVAADRVHVAGDLAHGRIEGRGTTTEPGRDMLSGALRFDADAPADDGWADPCGNERVEVGAITTITTAGDLRGRMFGFADWTTEAADGYAGRVVVGPRP